MGRLLGLLFGLTIVGILAGCGPAEPTPDVAATEIALTEKILATLTAQAPRVTKTAAKVAVAAATNTAAPTEAPTSPPEAPTAMPTKAPPVAVIALPTVTPLPLATPEPTATATPSGPVAMVNTDALNVRGGPGTDFPIVDAVNAGDQLPIIGHNEDGSWLEVTTPSGATGWVAATLVEVNMAIDALALAANIPTPPPTAIPPTPTALPVANEEPAVPPAPPANLPGLHGRQTIGTWEFQPERLHREKTVWHYGDPTTAMGLYAIVIVLEKNLAPGTTSPNETLGFFLEDERGNLYDYSDPLTTERTAMIAAAWQFVVHPTPFNDVDPGVETPMLMLWDVPEDVQSLKLHIGTRDSIVTWDLGNFSNIPHYEKE